MLQIISNVDHIKFDVEEALESQMGVLPLPFPGMDKSGSAICIAYRDHGVCKFGNLCPFRHIKKDKNIVCKHWLRGLCKKGDNCEFLHEYDMSKMPECYFFSKYNACSNKECPFLHIDPESKIKDCVWYDRGFCRHGPLCKNRHVRRVICICYLSGFCPDGKNCKFVHAKFDITQELAHQFNPNPFPPLPSQHLLKNWILPITFTPASELDILRGSDQTLPKPNRPAHLQSLQPPSYLKSFLGTGFANKNIIHLSSNLKQTQNEIICHLCGKSGHKVSSCPSSILRDSRGISEKDVGIDNSIHPHHPFHPPRSIRRNLEEVTCYKCGNRGHFANHCTTLTSLAMDIPPIS